MTDTAKTFASTEADLGGARLGLAAVAGPVLFCLAWLVLGFVSPGFTMWDITIAPYSPISAAVSGLGLGPTGPWMNAAFVASGLLVAIGGVGIVRTIPGLRPRARTTYAGAFGLIGLGLVIDGLFTLEQVMVHTLGFGLSILAMVVGYALIGRTLRRRAGWERIGMLVLLASPLTLALTVLFLATFSPTAEGAMTGVAGLTERILIVASMLPIVVLGWATYARR
jgi:Protein of unknown function (DUF998)